MRGKSQVLSLAFIYISQGISAVFPALVAPLIVRSIGLQGFGEYALLVMCAQGGGLISEYSFDASGPRLLKRAGQETEKASSVFWSVAGNKIALFPIAIAVGLLSTTIFVEARLDLAVIAGVVFHIVALAMQSSWFLIATDQALVLAVSNVAGRLFAVIVIAAMLFIDVHKPSYLFAATSAGLLLSAGIALAMNSRIKLEARFLVPRTNLLASGRTAFVGVSGAFIQNFLGQSLAAGLAGSAGAGAYAAVDKIARALSASLKPIFMLTYPRMTRMHAAQPRRAHAIILKASLAWVLVSIILIALTAVLSKDILDLLYGSAMEEYQFLLVIIIAWLCVGILNNILGIQGLLASGNDRVFATAMWLGILTTLLAAAALYGRFYGAHLAASVVFVGELAMTVYYGFCYILRSEVTRDQ